MRSASCRIWVAEWLARVADARGVIDCKLDRHAGARRPLDDRDLVDEEVAELLARVDDGGAEAGRGDFADVADLAAGLAVERRLVEDQRALLARLEPLDLDAVLDDRAIDALGGLGFVAEKIGGADPLAQARTRRSRSPPRPIPPRRGALRRAGAPSRR